jgi:Trichodiene synthase (TRI5)
MDAKTFKAKYRELLSKFVQLFPSIPQNFTYDLSIEQGIADHFESRGFPPEYISKVLPAIKCGAVIVSTSYPFLTWRTRVMLGLYSACVILIEDRTREIVEDLKNFGTRLFLSQPQPNRLLRCWVDSIIEIGNFCGPIGRHSIMKGSLEFVNACILEYEYHDRLEFPTTAPVFPEYLRGLSGIGEAYAFFIFPQAKYPEDSYLARYLPAIRYLSLYICYTNDIFSFYKESVISDEPLTFIGNYSRAKRITSLEALEQVYALTTEYIQRIRQIVSVDPRLQEDVEKFMHGYVAFHMTEARYRFSDLDIPGANMVTLRPKASGKERKQIS